MPHAATSYEHTRHDQNTARRLPKRRMLLQSTCDPSKGYLPNRWAFCNEDAFQSQVAFPILGALPDSSRSPQDAFPIAMQSFNKDGLQSRDAFPILGGSSNQYSILPQSIFPLAENLFIKMQLHHNTPFPIVQGFPVNVRSFNGIHSHSLGNLIVTISSTQATAVGPKLPSESSRYIHHNEKVTTNITFRHHFLCHGLEAHSTARTHPCTACKVTNSRSGTGHMPTHREILHS